ncbi:MAG: TIGR00269 family protein [Nanoarchaeota archaeon]|nr:TIGR00269 family protein [Nanoarchaeota archaeon]MCG2717302.1 TIGR00269 family protein [Nanoarchaeota archaeon]
MVCKNCNLKPVITLPNSKTKVCKGCFVKYFEKKAYKTIGKYDMLGKKKATIAIGISGGKDSFSVLYILNKLAETKRNLDIKLIAVDEGIKGYRDLSNVKKYCKKNGLDLHIYTFKKEFGMTLDEIIKKTNMKPCSVCGVLRRFLLNSKARELGVDKIATGHNLDDEAQSIIMNQFRGNIERSARLGPVTGVKKDKRFVRRIKPFYFLTEREVTAYCFLRKLPVQYDECPYAISSYRAEVRDMINNFTAKQGQTKHAIINSFLDILPVLKKKYAKSEIKSCKKCGEPCSGEVCKVCEFLDKIKKK